MEDHREREGNLNGEKSERERNHETVDTGKQIGGFRRERSGVRGNRVMAIREGTCCDEHWVLYANNESLNTTSKTNDILCSG